MASEKISELSEVSTLPDEALITGVDSTRSEGDKNIKMTVANAKTLFSGGGLQADTRYTQHNGSNRRT